MGPWVRKNSQNWQISFTQVLLSTSSRNSKSIFCVTTCVSRWHAAKWQSAGQRSSGVLCGHRDCISSSHPRSSQHLAIAALSRHIVPATSLEGLRFQASQSASDISSSYQNRRFSHCNPYNTCRMVEKSKSALACAFGTFENTRTLK